MKRESIWAERGEGPVSMLVMMALMAGLAIAAYRVLGPRLLEAVEVIATKIDELVSGVGSGLPF